MAEGGFRPPSSSKELRALIMSGGMFDLILHVISKPPSLRTDGEVEVLIPWLKKKSDMLSSLNKDILTRLVRYCTHEKMVKDGVIIRQGERGDCLYILVHGAASLYLKGSAFDDDNHNTKSSRITSQVDDDSLFYVQVTGKTSLYIEDFDKAEKEANAKNIDDETDEMKNSLFYIQLSGKSSLFIDTVKSDDDAKTAAETEQKTNEDVMTDTEAFLAQLEEEQRQRTGKKKRLDRAQFGKYILSFDPGKSFGEIALMTEDAIRNATIIADEDTDLLVIDRDLFNDTLKAKQEADYAERKDFIDRNPLFNNWNAKFKRLLEMSIRKESYLFEDVLVKQGEPMKGLIFIYRGQAKVLVDPDAHKEQFPRIFDASKAALARELGKNFVHKETKVKEGTQQQQVHIRRTRGYAAAEKRLAQKSTTLCFLDENEVIGDCELVLGLDYYTTTVVCTANTEIFILDNKNIERLIQKKNPHTLDALREEVESKISGRYKTNLGSHIELYKHLLVKLKEIKPKVRSKSAYRSRTPHNKEQTSVDPKQDRDAMLNQLVKLFIQDRAPFIEPVVPGTVYYMTKSLEKARKHYSDRLRRRSTMAKPMTGEVRLQRAKKTARRQPRSRRELERLTIAHDTVGMKPLQDRNSAVNRFLNTNPQVARPVTAVGYEGRKASVGGDGDRIFKLTEPDLPDIEDPDGQVVLGSSDIKSQDAMKHIVLDMADMHHMKNNSRAKIICSMIERRTNQPNAVSGLMRPKSAPGGINGYADSDDEDIGSFDHETSDGVLRDLEDRIKAFHASHVEETQRNKSRITELRRFNVERPEDVPIPGGTVYIRQKPCKYPPGSNVNASHHQHIRRFMIPKDAATIATKSLAMIESTQAANYGYQNGETALQKAPVRPHTSIGHSSQNGPPRRPKTTATRSRIKSAVN